MTEPFRTFAVVNLHSAGGATRRQWPLIQAALRSTVGEFGFGITSKPGDASRLASEAAAAGHEMIVAIGGDGTLSEIVDGLFDRESRPLREGIVVGTIARGTGKDFVRTAGVPTGLEQAARAMGGRNTRPWDVGKLTISRGEAPPLVRHYVNEADFGIGGEVARRVNGDSKVLGGFMSFLWATLRALATFRGCTVRLTADGEDLGERLLYSGVAAIGRYCGGGMMLAPKAEPDDGKLDLTLIPKLTLLQALANLRRIYDGSLLEYPTVVHRRCRVIEMQSATEVNLGIDGESLRCTAARFEILPHALRVKVPEPADS